MTNHESSYLYALTADPNKPLREAREEIERLRAERDEARRQVCNMMHKTGFFRGDYADSRGWDCFKENNK